LLFQEILKYEPECCSIDTRMEIPQSVTANLEKAGGIKSVFRCIPRSQRLTCLSDIFQSLSDPTRLLILYSLSTTPLCVCLIKSLVKIADSKLSYHLSCMNSVGLITQHSEGKYIVYKITDLGKKMLSICDTIEQPLNMRPSQC